MNSPRPTVGDKTPRVLVIGSYGRSLVPFRFALMTGLREAGCAVFAGIPRDEVPGDDLERLGRAGIDVLDIPVERHGINPLRDMAYTVAVARAVSAHRITALVPYTFKPVIFASVGAWLGGARHILPMMTGLGSIFTGPANTWRKRVLRVIVAWLSRFALGRAEVIYFQNPDDPKELARWGGVPRGAAIDYLAGSGVDVCHYPRVVLRDRERLEAGGRALTFLLVARLLADKGLREFAAAAAMVRRQAPATRFVLIGPFDGNPSAIGPEEVASWEWIDYRGEIDDLRPALAECDVFVLPSYREGTPRSVLEALATGRAVITSDAPGCRETVIEGLNGFFVPVGDSKALAAAMARFITEPALCARMGAESRRIAEQKFDQHRVFRPLIRQIAGRISAAK